MRIQKPIKNRKQVSARCIKEIQHEVEKASARFDVSKSFVIAVALADYFGIESQEQYYSERKIRRIK